MPVVVEIDRRRIGVVGDQFRIDEGGVLLRPVNRLVKIGRFGPRDDRDPVGPHGGITFAVGGGSVLPCGRIGLGYNHIAGNSEPRAVEPGRHDSREIAVPLRVARPRDDEIPLGVARNAGEFLRAVGFGVHTERLAERADTLNRLNLADVFQIRIDVRQRLPRFAAVGVEADLALVDRVPLNRKAAGVDIGIVVAVGDLIDIALPDDGERAVVGKTDIGVILVGLSGSDQNRIAVSVVDHVAVVVFGVIRLFGGVDAENRARFLDRFNEIFAVHPGVVSVDVDIPVFDHFGSADAEARNKQLLMVLVAAVSGEDDLEPVVGIIPFDEGVQRRDIDFDIREDAGCVVVVRGIGAVGAFEIVVAAHAVAEGFGVEVPLPHDWRVIGVGGGPFKRLFELRGHRRGIRGNRDADLFAGQKAVIRDRGGGAERFDECRRGRSGGVRLRGDRKFRNRTGKRVSQVGDVEFGFRESRDLDFRVIGTERAEGGLNVLGVLRRGEGGVDFKSALVAVQAQRDASGDIGFRGADVVAGIVIVFDRTRIAADRRRAEERDPLNRRRSVEKLKRGALADLRRFDRDGDHLGFIGQVAGVNVQVFADRFAGDRIGQLVSRRPRRDHIVRGVHVGGDFAADILPCGIDQHILDRTDGQTQQMPFFKRIDDHMAFFHLELGQLLFAGGEELHENLFASFHRLVPKLVDTCQRHTTVPLFVN